MRSARAEQIASRAAARLPFIVGACIVPVTLIAILLIGYDYYSRERDRLKQLGE